MVDGGGDDEEGDTSHQGKHGAAHEGANCLAAEGVLHVTRNGVDGAGHSVVGWN